MYYSSSTQTNEPFGELGSIYEDFNCDLFLCLVSAPLIESGGFPAGEKEKVPVLFMKAAA